MLKTISAALLATSLIAAPALAAGSGKAATNPTTQTKQAKTGAKADTKADAKTAAKADVNTGASSKSLNANAKMRKHHNKHVSHVRHQKQHKVAALKSKTHITTYAKDQAKTPAKATPKISLKQPAPLSKRS